MRILSTLVNKPSSPIAVLVSQQVKDGKERMLLIYSQLNLPYSTAEATIPRTSSAAC